MEPASFFKAFYTPPWPEGELGALNGKIFTGLNPVGRILVCAPVAREEVKDLFLKNGHSILSHVVTGFSTLSLECLNLHPSQINE